MDIKISTTSREDWLNKAALLILEERIAPLTDLVKTRDIRISIAPMAQKTLGCCYPASRSDDGSNAVFISAGCNDSLTILGTLAHELIHALDDCASKHGTPFKRWATQIGLEGKMTATTIGAELAEIFAEYIVMLGDIPHAALSHKAKDKGRNGNKIECSDCGFKANTSALWANQIVDGFECAVCGGHNTHVITK